AGVAAATSTTGAPARRFDPASVSTSRPVGKVSSASAMRAGTRARLPPGIHRKSPAVMWCTTRETAPESAAGDHEVHEARQAAVELDHNALPEPPPAAHRPPDQRIERWLDAAQR